jgi:hypothetical protein
MPVGVGVGIGVRAAAAVAILDAELPPSVVWAVGLDFASPSPTDEVGGVSVGRGFGAGVVGAQAATSNMSKTNVMTADAANTLRVFIILQPWRFFRYLVVRCAPATPLSITHLTRI